MLIEEQALRHWIDHFYGYGSWHAKFWFVSYEEGGGEIPEEVAEKLNYFYQAHQSAPDGILCDIREVYKCISMWMEGPRAGSFRNRYAYRFDTDAVQNNLWRNLIAFVHGWEDKSLPDVLAYQRQTFASLAERNEALIRLYPLPSPHTHSWYYSWLDLPLGFLKSRSVYQEHLYSRRMQIILSNMSKYKPEVVLMYGMTNINAIKNTVKEVFKGTEFKMIKAADPVGMTGRMPQHHRAVIGGTTFLITTQIPALRHNRIETGFDWAAFAKRVKNG